MSLYDNHDFDLRNNDSECILGEWQNKHPNHFFPEKDDIKELGSVISVLQDEVRVLKQRNERLKKINHRLKNYKSFDWKI